MSYSEHFHSFSLFFILFFALPLFVTASKKQHYWNPEDIPAPGNDQLNICNRKNTSFSSVCDPDGLLSVKGRGDIEGLIKSISEDTSGVRKADCGNRTEGYQFSVLVIRHKSSSFFLSSFSDEIFSSWGIGDAACGNGALLFVSYDGDSRRSKLLFSTIMHVSMGEGVKKILTNSMLRHVFNRHFDTSKFDYAHEIYASLHKLGQIVNGEITEEDFRAVKKKDQRKNPFWEFVFLVLLISCVCASQSESLDKILWICLIIFCLVFLSSEPSNSTHHEWKPYEIPHPRNDTKNICNRKGTISSSVCDPDRVLSREGRSNIEGLIESISDRTNIWTNGFVRTNCGNRTEGYQFSVLVLRHKSSSFFLGSFSDDVYSSWGIDDAVCGNSALLLVSYDDSQRSKVAYNSIMHVSMGKGVKKILTKSKLRHFFNRRFDSSKFDYAHEVYASLEKLGQLVNGEITEKANRWNSTHHAWEPYEIPHPRNDTKNICNRKGTISSSVCDPDRVLSRQGRRNIEGLIEAISDDTSVLNRIKCGHRDEGYRFLVLVLRHKNPSSYYLGAFADEIFSSWGVDDAACGNGALLLVSYDDSQRSKVPFNKIMHVSIGKGMKKRLNESMVNHVLNRTSTNTRFDYTKAIYETVQAMGKILNKELGEEGLSKVKKKPKWWKWLLSLIGLILFVHALEDMLDNERTRRERAEE